MRLLPFASVYLSLSLLVLAGCAGIPKFDTSAPATTSSLKGIRGSVHGGQQPVSGAHVYLFAASRRATAGTPTPSTGVMTSATTGNFPTTYDNTLGAYYVTTDQNGNFSVTGDYSCNSGDQIYVYVLGGNSGAGNNPYATLMAVLGTCPGTTAEFATIYPFVGINEVTTVAAAYAMAGFAVNPVTVSANATTQATAGLANAFATAANMADITSAGSALAATPAQNGVATNGIVPQTEIDTLANAVAACINSGGNALATTSPAVSATFSSSCSTLLNAAVTTTGAAATDTADALINLAHNPSAGGQTNVAAIYGLPPATGAPFQPALTSTTPPTDFSIAISYPAGSLSNTGNGAVAVDSQGNLWTTNFIANTVTEISPIGVVLSGANGFTDGGMNDPQPLAFDHSGNLWVLNESGGTISELDSQGNAVFGSPFTPSSGGTMYPLVNPQAIAVDASNRLWITDTGCAANAQSCAGTTPAVDLLSNGGGICVIANCGNIGANISAGVAIDTGGNAWISSPQNDVLTELAYSATASPPLYSVASLTATDYAGSYGVAIDSNGTKWVAEAETNQITSANTSGTVTSYPASGQPDGGINTPIAIAIDGAGSIWTANVGGVGTVSISEFTNTGVPLSPPSVSKANPGGFQALNPNLQGIGSIAIDPSGNVWVSDFNTIYLTELVGAATPVVTPIVTGVVNGTIGTQP